MRHRLGNSPKCCECFFCREKEQNDGCRYDGWCTNKAQLRKGINGHIREHPPEREPRYWNSRCSLWEDAEDRLTAFEVECRKPEEWRTEKEKEWIRELLKGGQ